MYYASRKLTPSRVIPNLKDSTCICKRFYLYLIGIEFEIFTDHKPLVSVLGAKSKPPSARIERWLLQFQQYSYSAIPAALVPSDVEKASAEDETLQIVRECIESGDWKRLTGTIYMVVKDELWIIGQIVMRGNRIILP